jgi:hypothetical protein
MPLNTACRHKYIPTKNPSASLPLNEKRHNRVTETRQSAKDTEHIIEVHTLLLVQAMSISHFSFEANLMKDTGQTNLATSYVKTGPIQVE